jgi:lactoylglutathione lyase
MPDEVTETSRRVVTEFGPRVAAGDLSACDDLVAQDFVNHAAGPRRRDGWRATFDHPTTISTTSRPRSTACWQTATR